MANYYKKSLLAGMALLLVPALAHAHTLPGGGSGLAAGLTHPLLGWDHLLVMLAVGVWAAQLSGRKFWRVPLTFVGMMILGGLAGVAGVQVSGVEFIVLLSVPVFGWLVIQRVKVKPSTSMMLAGFFAFFHGLAHGTEMPLPASVVGFVLGFALATLFLHGLGVVLSRLAVLGFTCVMGEVAFAQSETNAPLTEVKSNSEPPARLPEVVVQGRADSLLEIADSATEGTSAEFVGQNVHALILKIKVS